MQVIGRNKRPFPRKLFEDFSKRELQSFLEVIHYASSAETDEDIGHVLHLTRKLIPGQYLVAGLIRLDHAKRSHRFAKILNISYPSDWINFYLKNNYSEIDPVLLNHISTFRTQVWSNSYKAANTHKEREFIEEAKSFGLANGVTGGVFESKRNIGSFFSFAGGTVRDHQRYAEVLEYLTHYLHPILIKTIASPPPTSRNNLSPRELSVLSWMKDGKTNWEISRILGISERTVRFHVEAIFTKLDVTSRTQAVAMAMENGFLRAS